MKRWLLRISVVLSVLAALAVGSWWGWRTYYSGQLLYDAIEADDLKEVKSLLAWGGDVNASPVNGTLGWGGSPLERALKFARSEKLKVDGTPVPRAGMRGHPNNMAIIRTLIEYGADVNATIPVQTIEGYNTPSDIRILNVALDIGNQEIIDALKAAGARKGTTPYRIDP